VCRPFAGFEAAGFRDGENCIIAEPQDLAESHAALTADPDRAERIARAGQQMVLNQHSLSARADDLSVVFDAIAEGNFYGSAWQDGRHRLRTRAERSAA
jgi:spore maturation protein CgeB